MTLLSCGCLVNPASLDDYCRDHMLIECHIGPDWTRWDIEHSIEGLCPPCRIAKWRSVSLSSAATPTRGKA